MKKLFGKFILGLSKVLNKIFGATINGLSYIVNLLSNIAVLLVLAGVVLLALSSFLLPVIITILLFHPAFWIIIFVFFIVPFLGKKFISFLRYFNYSLCEYLNDYGNFLIQVFQLLDWYPNKIKLYTSICRPKIKSGKSFGEFDEENLFEIRKKIINLLSYKKFFDSNKISHIDVEYYVYDYVRRCLYFDFRQQYFG